MSLFASCVRMRGERNPCDVALNVQVRADIAMYMASDLSD